MSAQKKAKKAPKPLALVNENGLTASEAAAAKNLEVTCPAIVQAYGDYRKAEGEYASRFWSLAESLRMPVVKNGPAGPLPALRLNGREVALLLISLGEIKQRVTEWKKVVEMDDAAYAACRLAGFTKIETLGVARGTLEIEGEGVDAEAKPVAKKDDPKKPVKASFHKFSKALAPLLHKLLEGDDDAPGPKATDDEIPYELEGTFADGRVYVIRCFVDSKPVRAKAE